MCLKVISIVPFIFPVVVGRGCSSTCCRVPVLVVNIFFDTVVNIVDTCCVTSGGAGIVTGAAVVYTKVGLILSVMLVPFVKLFTTSVTDTATCFIVCIIQCVSVGGECNIGGSPRLLNLVMVSAVVIFNICCCEGVVLYKVYFLNIYIVSVYLGGGIVLNNGSFMGGTLTGVGGNEWCDVGRMPVLCSEGRRYYNYATYCTVYPGRTVSVMRSRRKFRCPRVSRDGYMHYCRYVGMYPVGMTETRWRREL